METVVSPARHPPARLAVYGERPEVRIRIEELLADATLTTTGRRADFESLVEDAAVGIVVLERCEPMDVQWLRGVFDRGHCAPSCVVLTPHTLTRFLRLRRLQSSRFHVVWAEELEGRLTQLLAQLEPWHRDPLRLLGHRLLSDFPLRSSLVTVIDRICSVLHDALGTRAAAPLRGRPRSRCRPSARHPAPSLEKRDSASLRPQTAAGLGASILGDPPPRAHRVGRHRPAGGVAAAYAGAGQRASGGVHAGRADPRTRQRPAPLPDLGPQNDPQSQACPFPGVEKIRS